MRQGGIEPILIKERQGLIGTSSTYRDKRHLKWDHDIVLRSPQSHRGLCLGTVVDPGQFVWAPTSHGFGNASTTPGIRSSITSSAEMPKARQIAWT